MTLSFEQKKEISEAATKYINHWLVKNVSAEFAENMKFELDGLPALGMFKVVNYAAQVAIAYERGLNPDDLILTAEEFTNEIVETITNAGPTID